MPSNWWQHQAGGFEERDLQPPTAILIFFILSSLSCCHHRIPLGLWNAQCFASQIPKFKGSFLFRLTVPERANMQIGTGPKLGSKCQSHTEHNSPIGEAGDCWRRERKEAMRSALFLLNVEVFSPYTPFH
ncbi:hypothetical protein DdX_05368 [Ditylenchus destructor]|uniref:Uncharacterized protein n=1 Tax=Ditylenchus destructor TaxID=166010 RepID=A0AAD4NCK5_9BILA|nr:hypothetical protein DdX_05368 [Ditylenchus destructor]